MIKWTGRLLRVGLSLAVVVVFLLLIVLPLATSLLINFDLWPSGNFAQVLHWVSHLQSLAMRMFFWAWIFFLGGCFASFLNVVAWRVPRGKSILGSSHCPKCDHKLTFTSNLPVYGWFRNEGKCVHCQTPIPPRYLLAEITLGAAFLILTLRETISGGVPIPFRTPNTFAGIEYTLFDPQWDLLASLAQHLVLLSLLFTMAIIRIEKMPIPLSIWLLAATLGITSLFLPHFSGMVNWKFNSTNWLHGSLDSLLAAGLGLWASLVAAGVVSISNLEKPRACFLAFSLVGLFLGWQSVLSVALLSLGLAAVFLLVRHIVPVGCRAMALLLASPTVLVVMATLIHLCCWQQQTQLAFWPSAGCSFFACVFAFAMLAGIAATIRYYLDSKPQMSTPTAI